MAEPHSNNSALTAYMIFSKTRANSLSDVRILNMWGYNLKDVSIFQEMPNVEVVSLSINEITTLRDFSNCFKLRELLLRHNNISDISEIQYLTNITTLRRLWLAENPIAKLPNYRSYVISVLPQLEILDEIPVTKNERNDQYIDEENDFSFENQDTFQEPMPKINLDNRKQNHRPRLLPDNFEPVKTNRRKQRFLDDDVIHNKNELHKQNQRVYNDENVDYTNIQENIKQPPNDEATLTAVLALLPALSADSISIVLDTICKLYQ